MIFLSLLCDPKDEEKIEKNKLFGESNSAAGLQWGIVDGILENGETPFSILNVLPVGTYPKQYKKLLLDTKNWNYKSAKNYQIGCLNLPYFKQHQRNKRIRKFLNNNSDHDILIYSCYYPFLKAISKLDSSYHITLIVPDLPQFSVLGHESGLRSCIRKYMNQQIFQCIDRVDKFVLLAEPMKDVLHVGTRPYTVVEGMAHSNIQLLPYADHPNEKIIFYAGRLQKMFGISNLLEAFSMIKDPECRLWLCGGGDAVNQIRKCAEEDSRIQFFGYVSKQKADNLQRHASVLVNPRTSEGEFTKYSFPSKVIDYMSTGIPVVMHKLPAIPDEYDQYVHYAKNETAESLSEAIMDVLKLPLQERKRIGQEAFEFISNEKNCVKQTRKILKLIGHNPE